MTAPTLSIPVSHWPVRDQAAWHATSVSNPDPFGSALALAQVSPRVRRAARHSVGQFMRWLAENGCDMTAPSVATQVGEEQLTGFIKHELPRKRLSSMSTVVYHLALALQAFDPEQDWTWARHIFGRVRRRALAEPPIARPVVHAGVLFQAGLAAMQATSDSCVSGHELYRNGLCVSLLAACPMRIMNLSTLTLGEHLRNTDGRWVILLQAAETKTRTPDFWAVPGVLTAGLDWYLSVVRPALLRRGKCSNTSRLWIGASGRPVGDQVIRHWIQDFTEAHVGVALNPHRFRHCAATTLTLERPSRTIEAASLLGHASGRTTERYYIMQQQQMAQVSYLHALEGRTKVAPRFRTG